VASLPEVSNQNKYFTRKSELRIGGLWYHEKLPMQALFEALKNGDADETLARAVDPARLPAHIAVIMDGNGRWAKRRGLPRVAGHTAGMRSVRVAIETCSQLGIRALTLYAFSVENWKRPRAEVEMLWRLLRTYLRSELPALIANGVRLNVIGRVDELPQQVQTDLHEAIAATSMNKGLQVNLAINYGGRAEIVDAVKALVAEAKRGDVVIDEAAISARLYTAGIADPDLLIRTSGEMRVSNFLLWQIAYSELYVTETLWPDFTRADLLRAVLDYQKRDRRFGGLGEQLPVDTAPPSELIDEPLVNEPRAEALGSPAR
jgi:undecaprenyl diphosphate synthase